MFSDIVVGYNKNDFFYKKLHFRGKISSLFLRYFKPE